MLIPIASSITSFRLTLIPLASSQMVKASRFMLTNKNKMFLCKIWDRKFGRPFLVYSLTCWDIGNHIVFSTARHLFNEFYLNSLSYPTLVFYSQLQLWDTGGMERVASITSSYYKFSEAAILVFALDSPDSFNVLSQHLLDVVTYAENAKIFLCGNKYDLKSQILVSDSDMETFRWEVAFRCWNYFSVHVANTYL